MLQMANTDLECSATFLDNHEISLLSVLLITGSNLNQFPYYAKVDIGIRN